MGKEDGGSTRLMLIHILPNLQAVRKSLHCTVIRRIPADASSAAATAASIHLNATVAMASVGCHHQQVEEQLRRAPDDGSPKPFV